jgi:hypothetical protein
MFHLSGVFLFIFSVLVDTINNLHRSWKHGASHLPVAALLCLYYTPLVLIWSVAQSKMHEAAQMMLGVKSP